MSKKYGFDLLLSQFFALVEEDYQYSCTEAVGDTEIERLFFMALYMRCRYGMTEFSDLLVAKDEKHEASCMAADEGIFPHCSARLIIRPQVKILDRRVDFLIHAFDWRDADETKWVWRKLIVECDGHNFHERTKEQAAKDRAKDRRAVLDGIDCFRFTGSELWRDPWGCAEQVTDWAVKGWG
jgi:very-short-patch-repair endonuclease